MKLSIILPVVAYDGLSIETLRSIASLRGLDFELVVVSPRALGATNEIAEIIDSGVFVKFVADTGVGIYSAMNDGANVASGDYLYFIGAGDLIYPEQFFLAISRAHTAQSNIFLSRVVMGNGSIFPRETRLVCKFADGEVVCHQGVLMKRSVFKVLGGFDLSYKFAADFDLMLRSTFNNYTVEISELVIAYYRGGGYSSKHCGINEISRSLFRKGLRLKSVKYFFREWLARAVRHLRRYRDA